MALRGSKTWEIFFLRRDGLDRFFLNEYHLFYAKIGFLLALLVILNIYASSIAVTIGLGRIRSLPENSHVSFQGLDLDAGEMFVYDFESGERTGLLEIKVLRKLSGEFLAKGKLTGHFIRADGSINAEFGEFMVEEYFIVNGHTGTSPGVNYFSTLWNSCGGTLLKLAEGGENVGSICRTVGAPRLENIAIDGLPGLAYARASPTTGYSDLKIKIRPQLTEDVKHGGFSLNERAVQLNMALAGLLLLKIIGTTGGFRRVGLTRPVF